MPSKFEKFRDGDALTPGVMNLIFDELDRLRGLHGSGLISVDNAAGTSPPTIVDMRGAPLVPAQLTAGLASGTITSPSSATMTLLIPVSGSPAMTPTGGVAGLTVYNFWALASTLASGTNILVCSWAGNYYLAQAAC